jgi:hypothetical protein
MKNLVLFEEFDPYKEKIKNKKSPFKKGAKNKNDKVVQLKNWIKY